MELIEVETMIAAPVERCFLLSLNIDFHTESAAPTGEKAIASVMHGLIGPGETVTWRGRHFGLMLTHMTVISKYDRPKFFEDSMVRGMFQSFAHQHFFEQTAEGTLMRDELRFAAPLRPLGFVAEKLVLRRYLRGFLEERNAVIPRVAESADGWVRYVG